MAIRSTTISLILLLSVSCFGLDSLMAQEQGVSKGHQNPFVVRCRFYHDNNNNYYYKIIENALTLTEDQYGPFLLESIDIRISSTIRKVKEIQSSRLYNLESIPVTKQLEEELYAIPFPLFGGLFGLRVLISHLNSIDALQQSKTIDDLRQFTFGHGKDWSDTEIFRQNQISVEVGDNSENLYKMLMKQRFDCFPRSFMEYQYELKLYHSKEIQLVEPFFIYYPYPNYFFVSHENKDIGDRILKGLQRSVQNGSYDMLLNQYYGKELLMLSRENRPVIQIENSFISDETIETLNHYILPDLKRLLGIHSH